MFNPNFSPALNTHDLHFLKRHRDHDMMILDSMWVTAKCTSIALLHNSLVPDALVDQDTRQGVCLVEKYPKSSLGDALMWGMATKGAKEMIREIQERYG